MKLKSEYDRNAAIESRFFKLREVEGEWEINNSYRPQDDFEEVEVETSVEVQSVVSSINTTKFDQFSINGEVMEDVAERLRIELNKQPNPLSIVVSPDILDRVINLQLNEVTLDQILEIFEQSFGIINFVEGRIITLGSKESLGQQFIGKTWKLPSVVIKNLDEGSSGGSAFVDPFASGNTTIKPSTANMRTLLQQNGIELPENASVLYIRSSSKLTVYGPLNTIASIDEFLRVQSKDKQDSQVLVKAKLIQISTDQTKEHGIEWFFDRLIADQLRIEPIQTGGSITEGIDFTSLAGLGSPLDSLIGSTSSQVSNEVPGVFSISQVFNDNNTRIRALVRALNQQTDSDVLSTPQLILNNGNTATLFSGQEIRFPSTYRAPQIPNTVTNGAGVLTPAHPENFELRRLGVELEVTANVDVETEVISLETSVNFSSFEGFIDYGTDIALSGDVIDNVVLFPVFSEVTGNSSLDIKSGYSVMMAGLVNSNKIAADDSVPLISSIPLIGKLFKNDADSHRDSYLLVLIEAELIKQRL